jgi:hypothetical protein
MYRGRLVALLCSNRASAGAAFTAPYASPPALPYSTSSRVNATEAPLRVVPYDIQYVHRSVERDQRDQMLKPSGGWVKNVCTDRTRLIVATPKNTKPLHVPAANVRINAGSRHANDITALAIPTVKFESTVNPHRISSSASESSDRPPMMSQNVS